MHTYPVPCTYTKLGNYKNAAKNQKQNLYMFSVQVQCDQIFETKKNTFIKNLIFNLRP